MYIKKIFCCLYRINQRACAVAFGAIFYCVRSRFCLYKPLVVAGMAMIIVETSVTHGEKKSRNLFTLSINAEILSGKFTEIHFRKMATQCR